LVKNRTLGKKISVLVKNLNFGIKILVENRNFGQKSKFVEILFKNRNFSQQYKFESKIKMLLKIKILLKNKSPNGIFFARKPKITSKRSFQASIGSL